MKETQNLLQSVLDFPQRSGVAVQHYLGGQLQSMTWPEYYDEIKRVTSALNQIGVQKGTRVAIKATTCLKWGLLDLGIQCLGGVTVPIYSNSTQSEVQHILKDSKAEFLFVENPSHAESIDTSKINLKKIFSLESGTNSIHSWVEFISLAPKDEIDWFESLSGPAPHELASIIYTSGTTGAPKGVCISSVQILSEVSEAFAWGISKEDTTLCFLPMAHVLGRVEYWAHVYWGSTLAFSEGLDRLRENLKEVQPTVFIGVPRVFEKFHEAILTQMESLGFKRRIFDWALDIGKRTSEYTLFRRKVPLDLALKWEMADKVVFSQIKAAFGGKLRFAISGGAPLSAEISHFFHYCGVLILEGYGLTETTAAIAVNRDTQYVLGTVGLPTGDVKIKIAEDGEILVKSNKVMIGYHNLPDETAKVLKDGWFYTGDIGEILPTGELRITDRKKDLIKTSGGKYIAPQKLENKLKESPLISNALIYGDQKKYVVTLLQLNSQMTTGLSKMEIDERLRNHIAEVNSELASFETIKKFATTEDIWSVENGLLTPSLKIKRKVLIEKYREQLEKLF